MPNKTVFTIGHSTHESDDFLALLKTFDIDCVIDVRSMPYSKMASQFNQPVLRVTLREQNIVYMHFAQEFGARHTEPALLDEDGAVDFDKVRASADFQRGVQRLNKGLEQGYRIALMCSEAEPFDCHRFSMISYQLVKEGLTVKHILKDGSAIDNSELEEQLLKKYQRKLLPQSTFFEVVTRESRIEDAYRLRGKDVAYAAKTAHTENPPIE